MNGSRRSLTSLMLVAGLAGTSLLAIGATSSLGGFTASITNTGDQVATGSLIMQEQVTPSGGTTTTCLSTAPGAAITTNAYNCGANKFGALTNAVPGQSSDSVVVVANQGSVTANSFSLSTGSCTATPTAPAGAKATNVGSDTSGFCSKVDVTIEDDTNASAPVCVYPASTSACPAPSNAYNLSTLASAYATTPLTLTAPVAPGASRTYKFTVEIDPSATNADQAMAATLPITFSFGS
jgi:hypothetical protein